MIRSRYEENAWPDIEQAVREDYIVVLPLGCTEQHGPHLPLCCDTLAVDDIAAVEKARSRGVPAIQAPAVPYGPAAEHMTFPGTVSLSFATWHALVREVIDCFIEHGFRRIVIRPGCGGHMGLDAVAYEAYTKARRSGRPVEIEVYNWQGWDRLFKKAAQLFGECTDVHAGEVETSWVMAIRPELVRADRIRKPPNRPAGRGRMWLAEEISDTGATGDPTRASAEAGRELASIVTDIFADYLVDFHRRTARGQIDAQA